MLRIFNHQLELEPQGLQVSLAIGSEGAEWVQSKRDYWGSKQQLWTAQNTSLSVFNYKYSLGSENQISSGKAM